MIKSPKCPPNKQVALLHSVLAGRMNQEAMKFMEYHLNNFTKNNTKTFHELQNKAVSGLFLQDLATDVNHYKLSLMNFRPSQNTKWASKIIVNEKPNSSSQSFDLKSFRAVDHTNHDRFKMRRKSCTCSYCGEPSLKGNLILGFLHQDLNFEIKNNPKRSLKLNWKCKMSSAYLAKAKSHSAINIPIPADEIKENMEETFSSFSSHSLSSDGTNSSSSEIDSTVNHLEPIPRDSRNIMGLQMLKSLRTMKISENTKRKSAMFIMNSL